MEGSEAEPQQCLAKRYLTGAGPNTANKMEDFEMSPPMNLHPQHEVHLGNVSQIH